MRHLITALAALAALLALTACKLPHDVNTGTVTDATGQPAAVQAPAEQKPAPTWGQRYTWPDGVAVEISKPEPCKPGKYAAVPANVERVVKFTVTIVNGTPNPYSAGTIAAWGDAQHAGRKAETVFDSNGSCGGGGIETATVMPGKTYSYDVAYAVGKNPGEMQLTMQPSLTADKAVFTGQA